MNTDFDKCLVIFIVGLNSAVLLYLLFRILIGGRKK